MQIQIGRFQNVSKETLRKSEYLNISNLKSTKVAKIIKYQPHRGSNHLLSVKSIKIEKKKGSLSYQTVQASLAKYRLKVVKLKDCKVK